MSGDQAGGSSGQRRRDDGGCIRRMRQIADGMRHMIGQFAAWHIDVTRSVLFLMRLGLEQNPIHARQCFHREISDGGLAR